MSKKPAVIVLTGPTAVGKTELSLRLAEALGGEIIGADSMQVYRGMDIGTAKASAAERARIPHHMIDVADPACRFSVADYVPMAEAALRDILARGRTPLICGGTGFYIQALLKGLDFSEEEENGLRRTLEERMEREGPETLHRELADVDPAAAVAIHPNNRKRVIRALEFFRRTGRRISDLNEEQREQESPYRVLYLVLTLPRETLYARINRRVDRMFEEGLEEEVRQLLARGVPADSTAMQALGYKEMLDCLNGRCTREEAAERIRLGSRHYAKRQLTWFRREKDAVWLDKSSFPGEDALFRDVLARCRAHIGAAESEAPETQNDTFPKKGECP